MAQSKTKAKTTKNARSFMQRHIKKHMEEGIEKEKMDIKATRHSVEISGKHSEKIEEKGKRYLYTERLYRSFYRNVPVPEEIVPSKVAAKVENGILRLELPKKVPTRKEDEETRVDVK